MRTLSLCVACLLIGALTLNVSAADKPEKGKGKGKPAPNPSAQMLKQLEPAKLTDEQVAKIKEAATKAQAESDKIIADAGIEKTALQARNKAVAEARQAGKSQKEVKAAGDEALGSLTDAQKEALKNADAAMGKFRKQVWEVLTADQRNALPEQVKKNLERAATMTGKKAA